MSSHTRRLRKTFFFLKSIHHRQPLSSHWSQLCSLLYHLLSTLCSCEWVSGVVIYYRVMDKPPTFLSDIPLSCAGTFMLVHVYRRQIPPPPPSHHLYAGQWREGRLPRLSGRPGHPFCLRLGGGGHTSHHGWYARGDDRALSQSRNIQAGDFLF